MTLLKCDRLIYKDLLVHVIKRVDLHVNFPTLIVVAGHDNNDRQNVMGKTYYKHFVITCCVKNNKI